MKQKTIGVRVLRTLLGVSLLIYMFTNAKMAYWLPFYTFQTNLFVGVWYILAGAFPGKEKVNFWMRDDIKGAITTYITITGLVYNLFLIPYEVSFYGYMPLASVINHMIVPVVMIVDFIITPVVFNPKWKTLPYWLAYPLLYAAITIFNGVRTGFYPYPFITPETVASTPKLIFNYIMLVCLHLGLAAVYLAIARKKYKKQA